MPLSFDRSAFTSNQLNSALSDYRQTMSDILPPDIKEKSEGSYTLFSDIDIEETSVYAPGINTPDDMAEALNTIARRDGFDASFNFDASDINFATGSTISFNIRTADAKYASGGTNRSFYRFEDDVANSRQRNPEYYRIGTSTTVGVTTQSFSINKINNSAGWFNDAMIETENFSIGGSDGWVRVGTGATLMIEHFGVLKTDEGSGQWDYGLASAVGRKETFDIGWPYVSPPQGSTGDGSGSAFNENLSSQVDGIGATFSTSNQYVSGTLRVYWNGQRLRAESTGQVIETGPSSFRTNFVPSSSTELIVDYIIK